MEAAPRFELGIKDLQSSALPLGYAAFLKGIKKNNGIGNQFYFTKKSARRQESLSLFCDNVTC